MSYGNNQQGGYWGNQQRPKNPWGGNQSWGNGQQNYNCWSSKNSSNEPEPSFNTPPYPIRPYQRQQQQLPVWTPPAFQQGNVRPGPFIRNKHISYEQQEFNNKLSAPYQNRQFPPPSQFPPRNSIFDAGPGPVQNRERPPSQPMPAREKKFEVASVLAAPICQNKNELMKEEDLYFQKITRAGIVSYWCRVCDLKSVLPKEQVTSHLQSIEHKMAHFSAVSIGELNNNYYRYRCDLCYVNLRKDEIKPHLRLPKHRELVKFNIERFGPEIERNLKDTTMTALTFLLHRDNSELAVVESEDLQLIGEDKKGHAIYRCLVCSADVVSYNVKSHQQGRVHITAAREKKAKTNSSVSQVQLNTTDRSKTGIPAGERLPQTSGGEHNVAASKLVDLNNFEIIEKAGTSFYRCKLCFLHHTEKRFSPYVALTGRQIGLNEIPQFSSDYPQTEALEHLNDISHRKHFVSTKYVKKLESVEENVYICTLCHIKIPAKQVKLHFSNAIHNKFLLRQIENKCVIIPNSGELNLNEIEPTALSLIISTTLEDYASSALDDVQKFAIHNYNCKYCNIVVHVNELMSHMNGKGHLKAIQTSQGFFQEEEQSDETQVDDTASECAKNLLNAGFLDDTVIHCGVCDSNVIHKNLTAHVTGNRHYRLLKRNKDRKWIRQNPQVQYTGTGAGTWEFEHKYYRKVKRNIFTVLCCKICFVNADPVVDYLHHLQEASHKRMYFSAEMVKKVEGTESEYNCILCNLKLLEGEVMSHLDFTSHKRRVHKQLVSKGKLKTESGFGLEDDGQTAVSLLFKSDAHLMPQWKNESELDTLGEDARNPGQMLYLCKVCKVKINENNVKKHLNWRKHVMKAEAAKYPTNQNPTEDIIIYDNNDDLYEEADELYDEVENEESVQQNNAAVANPYDVSSAQTLKRSNSSSSLTECKRSKVEDN